MLGIRQQLHTGISSEELQQHLDYGARIVYLTAGADSGTWNTVLEVESADGDPRATIVAYLASVDTGKLEQLMLEHPDMETGVGAAAIGSLIRMLVPSDGT